MSSVNMAFPGHTYLRLVSIMILASTVIEKSAFQDLTHINALQLGFCMKHTYECSIKIDFSWPCNYCEHIFKYTDGGQICATLVEMSKVIIDLWYLPIVIDSYLVCP